MAIGKWIGSALGWVLAGGSVLGAIAGYCVGSMLDDAFNASDGDKGFGEGGKTFRNDYSDTHFNQRPFEEDRNSFLFSMLVLSSYIIKADGKIMHSEICKKLPPQQLWRASRSAGRRHSTKAF